MIFVALGTEKFPFDRLVRALDEAVLSGQIRERVLIQSNVFDYVPKACETRPLIKYVEFMERIAESTCYVCHGGVGSIMTGLHLKKKPIVMPRYKALGENIDDHQVEITRRLADEDILVPCYQGESIEKLIAEAALRGRTSYENPTHDQFTIHMTQLLERQKK